MLGKGSKRRSVPVGGPALSALREWLAVRESLAAAAEPALFVGRRGQRLSDAAIRLRLKALALDAGLPGSNLGFNQAGVFAKFKCLSQSPDRIFQMVDKSEAEDQIKCPQCICIKRMYVRLQCTNFFRLIHCIEY